MEVVMSTVLPLIGDEAIQVCNKEQVLSFRDFVRVKNNFALHFVKTWIGDAYRKQDAYQRCMEEDPSFRTLAERLAGCAGAVDSRLRDLYKAYKLMRPYAQSNWEMFQ